jgi:DNA-binding GntR family transcriptional regulator
MATQADHDEPVEDRIPLAGRSWDIAIDRRTLPAMVADRMRDMIIRGDLASGQKVQVQALADSLGVSITPLREALKILAEDRLVELLPNRGARVRPHTLKETASLFEVIANLEGLAAELAAARISDTDLGIVEALHAQMRVHFNRAEKAPYFDLNSQIHEAILQASRNDALIGARRRLGVRAARGRFLAIIDQERWNEAMSEHEDVMVALRRRDAAQAGAIWKVHLLRTGAAVEKAQRSKSPFENAY